MSSRREASAQITPLGVFEVLLSVQKAPCCRQPNSLHLPEFHEPRPQPRLRLGGVGSLTGLFAAELASRRSTFNIDGSPLLCTGLLNPFNLSTFKSPPACHAHRLLYVERNGEREVQDSAHKDESLGLRASGAKLDGLVLSMAPRSDGCLGVPGL